MNQTDIKRSNNGLSVKFDKSQLRPLWIGVFSDILGFTILIPLLPFFIEEFGASPLELGLLLSANAIFGFISGPIFGKLSDKFGRKPLLLIAQFGTFLGFMVMAFSKTLTMLFVSRIIDGIFGGNFPIAKAVISDIAPPKERSKQMTNIGIMHNISNLIGPALGGFLARFGIIGPGLMAAGLSIVSILSTILGLKETAPSKTGEIPIALQIMNSNNHGKNENGMNNSFDEKQSIWKNKTAVILLIQWGMHTLAFMTYMSGLTLFANFKFTLDAEKLGVLLSIAGGFQIFIRFVIFNPMLKKIGEKNTSRLGLGLFVVAFTLIGLIQERYQFIMILLVTSFSATCVRGILTSFLSRSVHPKQLGKVMGYNTSLDSFAQMIGPLLSGYVLSYWNLNFYGIISAVLSIAAFLLIFKKIEFAFDFSETNQPDIKVIESPISSEIEELD